MATLRFKALEDVLHRVPKQPEAPAVRVSQYFGEKAFNGDAMREHLTPEAYRSVMDAVVKGERIERQIADQVAWRNPLYALVSAAYRHNRRKARRVF